MGSDPDTTTKMSNAPFYRQPWFYPICALVCIILYLQILPSTLNGSGNLQ